MMALKLFPRGVTGSIDLAALASEPRNLRSDVPISVCEVVTVARVVISHRAVTDRSGRYFPDLQKNEQECCLLVATPEGGAGAFGRLEDPNAPDLKKGDLVHWQAVEWRTTRDFPDPARPHWRGRIVALLDDDGVPMQVFRPAPLGRG